jgi:hypothetical protein
MTKNHKCGSLNIEELTVKLMLKYSDFIHQNYHKRPRQARWQYLNVTIGISPQQRDSNPPPTINHRLLVGSLNKTVGSLRVGLTITAQTH